ncbi:MAG: IS1 family transposase [Thioclava marina]|uniref:hypothetical protein n=1 Tax=Thioclava marina TaxID=1915077 RepID=UPI0019B141A2|nr:hypothetical protein [Thioclava marina]MBC7144887.1 IS1 family transposase [Thioclava marina]
MNYVSKISSGDEIELERRFPMPFQGVDFNFCRTPTCVAYGIAPDPFKRPRGTTPAPEGAIRGVVTGSKHEEAFQCPHCRKSWRLKNNRAAVEEYRRLRGLQDSDPTEASCRTPGCFAHGVSPAQNPEFYWKFGKTAGGDPRWRCRLCLKTFSEGKPARRHKRSDKNRVIFQMLCNDVSLAKISKIADISYRDLYRKIDFFYDQVRSFTQRRQVFAEVDFHEVGSRFATDSQTLTINWPTKRRRAPVMVQHLCTAHARSGYIMEASLQFDPSMTMDEAEEQAAAANEEDVSVAFRQHARIWTKSEFNEHLEKLLKLKKIEDVDLYQLPHDGVLVRYDMLQFAHAMRLREHLAGSDAPIILVMDDDKGLQQSFSSVFAPEIGEGSAEIAIVSFDKSMTNDRRLQVVEEERRLLAAAAGIGIADLRNLSNEDFADLSDDIVATLIKDQDLRRGFQYPFSRKSEPHRKITLLTDDGSRSNRARARLLRLATLRSVDAYFHKFRSNVRFAARPQVSAAGARQMWGKHQLYKPELMHKITEIYRFYHNWCELGEDRKTPAMRLGLARGRIYERDFL